MSEQPETMKELAARYAEAYDNREAGILAFLDDEGDLKEANSFEAYDEHSCDAWSDSHDDLGSLLSELGDLIGKVKKLTEEHQAREAEREARLRVFLDPAGNLKEEFGWDQYDAVTDGVNEKGREDLGALLGDLSALLG
ncbi:hypothetical protein [Streptomyces sp. NPDC092295]|uniref:hypothetical protein n=1 Tax=Streptomyces sp. NPDC092295 TaxID=3366011 RepID=UPI0037FB2140